MNHETYDERLALVKAILNDFNLEPIDIAPIDYDAHCPFPYNNFIFRVPLAVPVTSATFSGSQPCTVQLSEDVSDLVIRLSNHKADGLVHENRTENEVASIELTRRGLLASRQPEVISALPAIFAWKPAVDGGYGWIVMDFKPGVQLSEVLADLPEEKKTAVIGQIADIFAGVQQAPLPESIRGHYGGLAINEKGEIVPGKMTTLQGGPWTSYAEVWKTKFGNTLVDADKSHVIAGWKKEGDGGLREQIVRFVDQDLEKYLEKNGILMSAQGLVHGDFTTWNMLFDAEANKITGVVDFDFACVSHPAEEFLTFSDLWGGLGQSPDGELVAEAVLAGNFDCVDGAGLSGEELEKLFTAKVLNGAAKDREMLRPSTVPGLRALRELARLLEQIAPFRLVHEHFLKNKTADEIQEARQKALEALRATLISLL